jgi:hypothetical protein
MSVRLGRLADRGLVARAVLTALLRRLALDLEGPADSGGRLGMALAPAHVALRMRRAVGLPERVGVLVRGVARGGPAAAARSVTCSGPSRATTT